MALATVLFNLCCGPIVPLSDAMANYYAKLKMLDYGRTRLWGSVAFIAGSTVVGYLVAQWGSVNDFVYRTGWGRGITAFQFTPNQPYAGDGTCRPRGASEINSVTD